MNLLNVIQHTSADYLGLLEDHLEGRRIRFRYFRPFTEQGAIPGPGDICDGLVLLGGGYFGESVEYADTAIGPFFAERLRYTAWLANLTGLPVIVSSGRSDAPAAARILETQYGVKPVAVLIINEEGVRLEPIKSGTTSVLEKVAETIGKTAASKNASTDE